MNSNYFEMEDSGYQIEIHEFEAVCLFLGCRVNLKDEDADRIHEYCMIASAERFPIEPVQGENYGVFLKSTQRWVRGQLKETHRHIQFTEYKLFLIDRGDYETVRIKYMTLLAPSMNHPPRSFRIGLDAVLPDVDLYKQYIAYIMDKLHKGIVYFKETRRTDNIVFGTIVIKPHANNLEPMDLATHLVAKGLVKVSDNFEIDVVRFYSQFKGFKEDLILPQEEIKIHEQIIESKFEKTKEDKHMRNIKINKAPQRRDQANYIDNKNQMRENSYPQSLTDTGYSSDEDRSKLRFVHEDVQFVPAGFQPKQEKRDNRYSKKEIHIPRTYYQIMNEKQRTNTNQRSRSLGRPTEKSRPHIASTSKSCTRKPDVPQGRTVDQRSVVSAGTDKSSSENSSKKQVSWGSTSVKSDMSIKSEPLGKKSENIVTDRKRTRAFNLNSMSTRKMEDVNRSFSKEIKSSPHQTNFVENNKNEASQSSIETSNSTSDKNENLSSNSSGKKLVATSSMLVDSADSSTSSVELSTLSKKQQLRLMNNIKLPTRESVILNSQLTHSILGSPSSDTNSSLSTPESSVFKGESKLKAEKSVAKESQTEKSIPSWVTRFKMLEDSGIRQLNANQSLGISGNSSNVSNSSIQITDINADSLNCSSNLPQIKNVSATSTNSSVNLSGVSSVSSSSINSTYVTASSLNCSSNQSQTQTVSGKSINSSGQTESSFNLSGASSGGGSDISNLSKKQQYLLLYKGKTAKGVTNNFANGRENNSTPQNQNVINNQNVVKEISQRQVSESYDKKSLIENEEDRKQKVHDNESYSYQRDSSGINDQSEISNNSSKYFSAEEEMHQKLNEWMVPSEEDTRQLEYGSLQEVSYATLQNNINIAAGVLVHTRDGRVITAISTLSESSLDPKLIQRMEQLNLREMSRIQKYSYPIICGRHNVAMISGPRTGKTAGYAVPLASNLLDPEFYLSLPPGCGPRAIVVTPYWQSGNTAANLFHSISPQLRVVHTYGGGAELEKRTELLNGCDILVSTPKCLLRLLEHRVTDLKRLCHIVLDDTDILLEKFKKEIEMLIVFTDQMEQERERKKILIELQVVFSSSRWTAPIEVLVTRFLSNPTICIATQLEACVYTGIKPTAVFVESGKKLEKLHVILKEIEGKKRTVVMCKSKSDVKQVYNILLDLGVKNVIAAHEDISSVNMAEIPLYWEKQMDDVKTYWEQSCSLPILVRSDEVLEECPVTNAEVLIHYNMPSSLKMFSLRFTCIMSNYRNILTKESHYNKCKVFILMDEENDLEAPGVMKFMTRLGTVLPEPIQQTLEKIQDLQQEKKITEPLCEDLKQFGRCWNTKNCSFRHVFSKEHDLVADIPCKGQVKIMVQYVHNVCHFSARLLEHAENKEDWKKISDELMVLSMKMNNYYGNMKNKALHGLASVGDMVTVESSVEVYHRAVVLKVTKVNKDSEAETVNIRLIDNGRYQYDVRVVHLYHLPEELKAYPPSVVDVYLCHLMPKDLDISWSLVMREWVVSKIQEARRDSPNGYLCGKIVLSVGRNLWLDPVEYKEYLPSLSTTVVNLSLRAGLLSSNNATDNPDHIANLRKLCRKADITVEEEEVIRIVKPVLPKPDWAWLPQNKNELVYIVTVHSPTVLFLRLSSLSSRLQRLENEIQEYVKTQTGCSYIKLLEVGDICLGKSSEGEMCRAIIHSKPSEDQVELFFVDYGDFNTVSWNDVLPISPELITKLPFQVIECYLAGVLFPKESDIDWEDDVIEEIYNLSRSISDNLQEEAINLCVKVVGVEPVGTLSKGRRYKVVLSNCENQQIINKQLTTAGLAMLIDEEKHFLEEPLYIETQDDTSVDSDYEMDEVLRLQDVDITTVVQYKDHCDVLPPENFNLNDKVADDEKERIIQKFLADVASGHLEYSAFDCDEFNQTLDKIAITAGEERGSSDLSPHRSRDSLPQIQYSVNVDDEEQPLNYSSQNSILSESILSSRTTSSNYEKKEYLTHPLVKESNEVLRLNKSPEENIEILNKTYLESMQHGSSFQISSNTQDENNSLKVEEDHNLTETDIKVVLNPNNKNSPFAKSTPCNNVSKHYPMQELSPIIMPPNNVLGAAMPNNLISSSLYRSPSCSSIKSKFCTNLESLLSPGSSGSFAKLNLIEKLNPLVENISDTSLNEFLKDNNQNDSKSHASISDYSNVARNHIGFEYEEKDENVFMKSEENKSADNVQSSDIVIDKYTSNVGSSQDVSDMHILADSKVNKERNICTWVESIVQSDSDEGSSENHDTDCNLSSEQTHTTGGTSIPATSSTAFDPLEEISNVKARCPMALWHQDDEFVWIHIKLPSVTQYKFTSSINTIEFRAIYDQVPYHVNVILYGAHNCSTVRYEPKAFYFEIKLEKILKGKKYHWPRLTEKPERLHWLKLNSEYIEDIEDEDDDIKNLACSLPHWNDNPVCSESKDSDTFDLANSELSLSIC